MVCVFILFVSRLKSRDTETSPRLSLMKSLVLETSLANKHFSKAAVQIYLIQSVPIF